MSTVRTSAPVVKLYVYYQLCVKTSFAVLHDMHKIFVQRCRVDVAVDTVL